MSTAVIQAEGLGKLYRRGVAQDVGLRHALDRFVKSPLSALRRRKRETFWALKDVSLDVKEGEVLGLVGRNGAGKTTLLKILSRITKPTAGWAEIRGRVGSLLEVGTGFHPELTGRENAFLSGAILGMSKREIARKFDEIVAFAELEQFIDTPVKHYSSGMYVRLAFAVAAHLEPEILLVDEVLAVGDIRFQKKCLGKMGDVARAGRTVVLVSHQMNQIRRLCNRVVWVDDGQLRQNGNTHEVVSAYESAMARGENGAGKTSRAAESKGRFVSWAIREPCGDDPHTLRILGPTVVQFTLQVNHPIENGMHGAALYNQDRQLIWAWSAQNLRLASGQYQFGYSFPMLPLRPGPYSWLVSLFEGHQELDVWECLPEMLVATENYQHQLDAWNGLLNIPSEFEVARRN
ncbi:MAG TPA: polysaccharide ABC transporter ATP-binding protein [Candidatus Methylomirabilis sp.]|nr:polysaccharide ABC transporter ATP-binding protein [Candidatus Methylomirabilis sp.]